MTRADLRAQILRCHRCPLHTSDNHPVAFRGRSHARVLIVGEAPGRWETRAGKPFVGPAGALLGRMLDQSGFDVNTEVAFANSVCCFPERTPTDLEVEACATNLDDQVEFLDPEVVVLCGLIAAGRWWPGIRMNKLRGRWFEAWGRPCMVTWHPAAVLRDPLLEAEMRLDVAKVRLGPALTATHERDYQCVECGEDATRWFAGGGLVDVSEKPGGLGLGWCVKDVVRWRKAQWRKLYVQTSMELGA